jgi:GntR family transcriptional regulator, transcriptional repressor for pyruvate dehydrogenase complex
MLSASPLQVSRMRRPKGLANELVESIANQIRDGAIKVGDKLPTEALIMEMFGVSRTVVREAISKLQASGMVETRHGIGTFVTSSDSGATFAISEGDLSTVQDILMALELRISLESEAAGLAAQRSTPENILRMEQSIADFNRGIAADEDTLAADYQFHTEIAIATGNPHFVRLMNYLGTMIIPRSRLNTVAAAPEGKKVYLQRISVEHENILRAISQGDADGAKAAMRMHLSNSRDRLRRTQAHTKA